MATRGRVTVVRGDPPWRWDKDYTVQVNESLYRDFPGVSDGDYLLLQNTRPEQAPAMFARVQRKETLEAGEVAIGVVLRKALGVSFGADLTVSDATPPSQPLSRFVERKLRFRPLIFRTRKATDVDAGFRVCRIPSETRDLLGIEWGDRVIVESLTDRVSAKALPLTDAVRTRRRRELQEGDGSVAYAGAEDVAQRPPRDGGPDRARTSPCLRMLRPPGDASAVTDIPSVYLDVRLRSDLGLTNKPNSGVCQPVRIYRDVRSALLRSLNDVAVPVVVGALGFLVVFDSYLRVGQMLAIFAAALLFVVASVLYRTRTVYLD